MTLMWRRRGVTATEWSNLGYKIWLGQAGNVVQLQFDMVPVGGGRTTTVEVDIYADEFARLAKIMTDIDAGKTLTAMTYLEEVWNAENFRRHMDDPALRGLTRKLLLALETHNAAFTTRYLANAIGIGSDVQNIRSIVRQGAKLPMSSVRQLWHTKQVKQILHVYEMRSTGPVMVATFPEITVPLIKLQSNVGTWQADYHLKCEIDEHGRAQLSRTFWNGDTTSMTFYCDFNDVAPPPEPDRETLRPIPGAPDDAPNPPFPD